MKLLCMVGWFEQGSLGFSDSHLFHWKAFCKSLGKGCNNYWTYLPLLVHV